MINKYVMPAQAGIQSKKHFILMTMFLFFLSGCAPVKLEQPATYVFSAPSTKPIATKPTAHILLIAVPKAAPGYDSPRMVYVNRPYELSYFAKNRWADSPARMLMPLFTETLQASRHFKAVVSAPYVGDTDLRLDTELLSLQQDFIHKPSSVRMVLLAQLIDVKNQRILGTRQFELSEKAPHNDPYGGVVAANRIVARLLPQLVAFVVHSSR